MRIKRDYFFASIAVVLALCAVQIRGNTMMTLACLGVFMALMGLACVHDYTLPMLLFFLPWSQLLRLNPSSFSFYTFAIVMICAISVVKKRFFIKRYPLVAGIALMFLTLLAKLLDGYELSFDYVAFMMLIVLFPVVKEEATEQKYDFFEVVSFFSVGIIVAALCAQQFARYPNIAKFIRVDSYLTITRMCGFYGDPNYYTAQITAALAGAAVAILRESNKKRISFLAALMLVLVYCGFLSGSKSFVLVAACVLCLWYVEVLRLRKRTGLKILLIMGSVIFALFIATSALFSGWLNVIITRFSFTTDISSFTTGRTELWGKYLNEILSDVKVLLIGKGLTNVKVDGRASHSTLIQIVFQLGILSGTVLVAWISCLFRDMLREVRLKRNDVMCTAILLLGAFLPWMAIDVLLFDEFFLLQWYVCVGVSLTQAHKGVVPKVDRLKLETRL